MSRRVSLGDLAERSSVPAPPPASAEAPEPASERPQRPDEPTTTATRAPRKALSQAKPASRPAATPPSSAGQWQRFDAYERKESRLRPDQAEVLGELSRRLSRARAGKGERLTENTLIRVAIDLLVSRDAELAGSTEAELRQSLGL